MENCGAESRRGGLGYKKRVAGPQVTVGTLTLNGPNSQDYTCTLGAACDVTITGTAKPRNPATMF